MILCYIYIVLCCVIAGFFFDRRVIIFVYIFPDPLFPRFCDYVIITPCFPHLRLRNRPGRFADRFFPIGYFFVFRAGRLFVGEDEQVYFFERNVIGQTAGLIVVFVL